MLKPVVLCADDEVVVVNSLKIELKKEFNNANLYENAESAVFYLQIPEPSITLTCVAHWH